ncbi:MAG TPA: 16S rRNA (guanine(966)-N(2))-methyltransferase RsmD [Myxococcales bacterium]|nr:16S rRNA (guanine(966)-N(2))-methyltransferase RsmD [Myxococcales bacterium]
MRIVAGSARGRPLQGPRSAGIRPTADRVRESVFNILGQWLDGQRVLDLYAGTGALGLEAISRGAAEAVLVDSGKEAVALCRENARALGFEGKVRVVAAPVERAVEQLERAGERFDLVFADPPYALEAGARAVERAEALLAPGGACVVEHDKREALPEAVGRLRRVDQRSFGDTRVAFFRFLDPVESGNDTGPR